MCLNTAPQRPFGGDLDRVGRDLQSGEAEPVEMRQPRGLISEPRLWSRRQNGDRRGRQAMLAHIAVSRIIEDVIGMSGTQQIEEVHAALRGPSSEPGEPFIADLAAWVVSVVVVDFWSS